MYPTGGGGGRGFYENCLNISGGCLFFVRFCVAFVMVLKGEKRKDKYSSFFQGL